MIFVRGIFLLLWNRIVLLFFLFIEIIMVSLSVNCLLFLFFSFVSCSLGVFKYKLNFFVDIYLWSNV